MKNSYSKGKEHISWFRNTVFEFFLCSTQNLNLPCEVVMFSKDIVNLTILFFYFLNTKCSITNFGKRHRQGWIFFIGFTMLLPHKCEHHTNWTWMFSAISFLLVSLFPSLSWSKKTSMSTFLTVFLDFLPTPFSFDSRSFLPTDLFLHFSTTGFGILHLTNIKKLQVTKF